MFIFPWTSSEVEVTDSIETLTLSSASVWYAYTLPTDCVYFAVKARGQADVKVSMSSTGSPYFTILGGTIFPQVNEYSNISGTYYFNCASSEVLEITTRSVS